jgi:hypothetical protein
MKPESFAINFIHKNIKKQTAEREKKRVKRLNLMPALNIERLLEQKV